MKMGLKLAGFSLLVALVVVGSLTSEPVVAQTPKPGHDWYRRAYAAGQYGSAMAKYKAAARWADKFAQYNIGVMYLRAEGVEFDPVKAWAWLELAAERDYPQLVEAADDSTISSMRRSETRPGTWNASWPRYGEKPESSLPPGKCARTTPGATGSRAGGGAFLSYLTIIDGSGQTRRGDEYYAAEKWDFERIIEYETRVMFAIANGNVELGELELIDDDEPDKAKD